MRRLAPSWPLSLPLCLSLCMSLALPIAAIAAGTGAMRTQSADGATPAADAPAPSWTADDVRASRVVVADVRDLPNMPVWRGDPMRLFVVFERGDDHVSLVDGDRFERIHRFPARGALHVAPQFSPDGRFAYFGARDGWITRYDLWNLAVVAQVRTGHALRDLALSADGRWLLVANERPHTLVLLDADLRVGRVIPAASPDGARTSSVSAVRTAAPRRSFVVTFSDLPELWEISYDPAAEDIYDGLVHDFRMGEGIPRRGYLGIRRTKLPEPMQDFVFDPTHAEAFGATRTAPGRPAGGLVVNLDVRRTIATIAAPGTPHPGSGVAFSWGNTPVVARPYLDAAVISVIETKGWRSVATIPNAGPGMFLRGHAGSAYLWADAMTDPSTRDTLTILDKRSLEVATQVRAPGRTLGQVEFGADGRHALVSVPETHGALIVYDARTFREVARLDMKRPAGVFNVHNRAPRAHP